MKQLIILFIPLLCLQSCRPYDQYTGEPMFSFEYSVNGTWHSGEDWNKQYGGLVKPVGKPAQPGLFLWKRDANDSFAVLSLDIEDLRLWLQSDRRFFIDGVWYSFSEATQNQEEGRFSVFKPAGARVTGGRYMLTRKVTDPCSTYEVHFELTCSDDQQEYEITGGRIQIGRRFQGYGNLIQAGGAMSQNNPMQ